MLSGSVPGGGGLDDPTLLSPAAILLDLPVSMDTGASDSDNITRIAAPTLDVTVDEAGTVRIDFDADGTFDDETPAAGAGVYSFTPAADLLDGTYNIQAEFIPTVGDAVSAALPVTIDTTSPTGQIGAQSAPAPYFQRKIAFSEEMDPATLPAAAGRLEGPGGTDLGPALDITGAGTDYIATFEPLNDAGQYTLALDGTVTDVAGNELGAGSGFDDTFSVISDLADGLWITRLMPTGPAAAPFDTVQVVFSSPIDQATFTAADVHMSLAAGGDIAADSITKLGTQWFEVSFAGLTGLDIYDLAIGPGIETPGGIEMDQDHDSTPGEAVEDAYAATLIATDIAIAQGDTTYAGKRIVLYGATAMVDGPHDFIDIELLGSSVMRHSATTSSEEFSLALTVSEGIWIDPTSSIDVSGRGYVDHYTLGNTTVGGTTVGAGGSYGGFGAGGSEGGSTNDVYGDYRNPNELGSGGGGNGGHGGGSGGGLIRITAGSAVVDGVIAANGADGYYVNAYHDGGGGSGGGIRLDVGTLSGAGWIRAEGGGVISGSGGSGGGGRVAIYYWDTMTLPAGNVLVDGGSGGVGAGTAGTVHVAASQGPTDMVVAVDTAPTWTVVGQTIHVTWIGTNQGDIATDALWFDHVYLSANPVLDASDTLLATVDASGGLPLPGHESYTLGTDVSIPYDAATGGAFLLFEVDGSKNQAELNDVNNVWASAISIQPPLPDMQIRNAGDPAFTGDDVYNATGTDQTVQQSVPADTAGVYVLKVQNDRPVTESFTITGQAGAPGWTVRYYDAAAGGTDISHLVMGGGWSISSVPAGGDVVFRMEVTPDLNEPAGGSVDVLVTAAATGEPNSLDRVKAVTTSTGGTRPDLVIAPIDTPATADFGQVVPVTVEVTNQGLAEALRSWVEYVFLSASALPDGSETLLATHAVGADSPLAAGNSYRFTTNLTIPYTAGGPHYLLLVTDGAAQQPETLEDNNVTPVPIDLHGPDLTVTDITWPAGPVVDGQQVTVSAQVENIGTGPVSGDFTVRFEIDGGYVGRQLVSAAAVAGGPVLVEQAITAAAGGHSVRARVDEYNAVFELLEDNNELTEDLPEVLTSDLQVMGLAWPAGDIHDGDEVTLTATIENIGAETLRSFVVRFEDVVDGFIGRQTVTGGIGASATIDVPQTWTARPGVHTIRVTVDEYNAIGELLETNNTLDTPLPEVLAPDLTVPDVTWLPVTIGDSDLVTFNVRVENLGAETLSDVVVTFRLDGNIIGQPTVSGLGAGAWTDVPLEWTAEPGDHTLLVTVDEAGAISELDEGNNDWTAALPNIPDSTDPVVAWLAPANGGKLSGTKTIAASAADNVGVTGYMFEYSTDQAVWLPLGAGVDPNVEWDTTPVADGDYFIRATAADAAGNAGSLTYTYTIDNTPPAPVALSATGVEFGVELSWTEAPETDLAYYRLLRSETPGGPYAAINGAMTQTTFVDSDVVPGATYHYVAIGLDHVGNTSDYSNEVTAVPEADLTAPTIHWMSPAAGSRSSVDIALNVSASDNMGVTDYTFEYSPNDGETWLPLAGGASASFGWDVSALASGEYLARVTVSDAQDNTSDLAQAYTVDRDAPATPANLRVTAGEVRLTVAWDPVIDADFRHYILSRSVAGGPVEVVVGATSSSLYIDTDVDFGVSYEYKVAAADDLGNISPESAPVAGDPLADGTPPLIQTLSPANGMHVRGQITLVAMARDAVRVDAFEFEYAPVGTTDWTLIGQDLAPVQISADQWGGQTAWDTDAVPEGEYAVRAKAIDYGDNMNYLAHTVIVDRGPPAVPGAPSITDPRSGGTLELSWAAVADPALSGYRVYRSDVSGSGYVRIASTGAAKPSHVDTGLQNDKPYHYVIAAVDLAGNESSTSAETTATPTAEVDLVLTGIALDPAVPVLGRPTTVTATVRNDGPASGAAEVQFYDGDVATGVLLGTGGVSLAAGATGTATFAWTASTSGVHTVTVLVVATSPADVDEGNNSDSVDAVVNIPPVADAGGDKAGDWAEEIDFDPFGSYDDDGLVNSYFWDFGDGETSAHALATHAYAMPGLYIATLRVTDNRGAASQDTCQVTVADTRADLDITNLTWNPVEPEERDDVTITATITNIGNGPTLYGFFVTFYIDGLYRGYQRANGILAVGESTDIAFGWTATKGLHTLQVVADDIQDNIQELDETNNGAETALTLQQVYFPDLVVEEIAFDIPGGPVSSEHPLTATATVANRGDADAFDFWVNLYHDGEQVGHRHVTGLVVDETLDLAFQFGPVAGDHTLTVAVDDPVSSVLESDENNNALVRALGTLELMYPDLTVSGITVLPNETTLSDGTSFDITAVLANDGDVPVERRFGVSYYLDGEFVGRRELTYLAAGASQSLALQARATPGLHVVTVVVDEENVVRESDETNNAASADIPAVTILYPDLVVSNVTWQPLDPVYAQTIGFTVTVSNQTVVSTMDNCLFKLSVDGQVVGLQDLPRIRGNSSVQFVVTWLAKVSPNTDHVITAVVDSGNSVHEENEANNEWSTQGGVGLQVADSLVLDVGTPGGAEDMWDQLFYSSRQTAEFVAEVTLGSAPQSPLGRPEVDVDIVATWLGHFDEDEFGAPIWVDDQIVLDEPMTYDSSVGLFNSAIDLLSYGTGQYSVRITATDGVYTAVELLNMLVIEEINFTLTTDKEVYQRGEAVMISGQATRLSGDPVALEKVALVVTKGYGEMSSYAAISGLIDQTARMFQVTTDATGAFAYAFHPMWGDAGEFSVDSYVVSDVFGSIGHTEFSILAMDVSPAKLHVTVSKNRTYTTTLTLKNLSDDPLTGLAVTLTDTDPDDNVTAVLSHSQGTTLEPGAAIPLTLTVTIPETAPDAARFTIHAVTNEGPVADGQVRFTLAPARPVPELEPRQVKVALQPGGYLSRTVTLTNHGMGTMSGITLVDPPILPWVALGGLGSDTLAPGQSTTFDILIAPGQDVRPGVYADRIIATDGTYQADMVLTVEVSTANRGAISFVIVNDAAQKVSNAEILLVSREVFQAVYGDGSVSTYHNTYRARTDADGVAVIEDMPVGEYDYAIGAPGHESVRGAVDVMPASEARIVNVTMTAVILSYQWTVTPIIIEDTYDITLNMTFVADVPKPVFAFLPPWVAVPQMIDDAFGDQVVVINPSLIELHDISARVVGIDGVYLTAGGQIGDMAPQSSMVLGYRVEPGDYSGLDGKSTYIELEATYVEFDPITFEPKDEESRLVQKIPLVNPSGHKAKVVFDFGGNIREVEFEMPEGGDGEAEEFEKMGDGGLPGFGSDTVTEVVKLEIRQTATLEREGFDAQLELTNGMDRELVSLSISPRVTDEAGVDVTDRFYIVPPELTGVTGIDGSDNLGAYGTMTGRWILIPGSGLGGTDLEGKSYWVKAVMSYYVDGTLRETQTNAVEVTVHPQPQLYLHYYIPRDVLADTPFKLGLLVENVGDGVATNLKIDSGQPEIIENEAGLLIDFEIVSSSFGSQTGDIVRLVLGDVQPHSSTHGYWIMTCTLDGMFIEFTAEMTHRAYKGIQINPLILDVFTEIILHDNLFADAQDPNNAFSLIDRDGDGFPDYLMNLYTGLQLPIITPQSVTVTRPPTAEDRTMELEVPAEAGYVCIILPDPMPEANYRSVMRHGPDGGEDTYLSGNNFWRDGGNIYFVDELGYIDPDTGLRVAEAGTYTLDFRSALDMEELNVAPKEFSVLFPGDERPSLGEAEELYIFHEPPPDSALGTYELVDPVFYIPTPPTVGQKAAIRAVVTNNGVLAETGTVEYYVTDPDENTVLLAAVPVDELRPWRHDRPIVEWIPAMPGQHVITARIPGDSPEGEMSVTVNVNAMPFADAGADFFSEVATVTSFDGTRSSDEDGYLRLFFWDFEDDDQWAGGMTPAHVYENSGTYQVHLYVKDDVGAISEDVMQVTINETRPDLVVEAVAVTPADPQEGQQVTITGTVRNIGYSATPAGSFYVGLYVDGAFQGLVHITQSLAVGESVDVPLTWTATTGNHMFTFVADDQADEVGEANEDNNEKTVALFPDQVYFPDLVPTDVTLSVGPEDPTPWGEAVTLTAHVQNAGTAAANAFRVTFHVDGEYVGYDVIDSLSHEEGSNVASASVPWVPTEGEHRVYVFVDWSIGHVTESDEKNNKYAEDIPELNIIYGDLRVDRIDLWPGSAEVTHPDLLQVSARIVNDSTTPIIDPFEVSFDVGDFPVGAQTIDSLAAGGVVWVSVWAPVQTATMDILVIADEANVIPEADESNNVGLLPDVPVVVTFPDVIVESVSWAPAEAVYGEETRFTVRIRNVGSARIVDPFNVTLEIDGELIDAKRFSDILLPGGSGYWFPTWTSDMPADGTVEVKVTVDALDELAELTEDNSIAIVSLPVRSGYEVYVRQIVLEGTEHDLDGYGTMGEFTYVPDEAPIFLVRLAESDAPEDYVDGSADVAVSATVLDSEGIVQSVTAMNWDADRFAFVEPIDLAGLATGEYALRVDVTMPDRTLYHDLPLTITKDFALTLTSDQEVYDVGASVVFSGTAEEADATPLGMLPVEVIVLHARSGTRQTLAATTDAAGHFSCTLALPVGEGGTYSATASANRSGIRRLTFTQFSAEGLGAIVPTGDEGTVQLWTAESQTIVVEIENLGATPVSGLTYSVTSSVPGRIVPLLDLAGTATSLSAGESTSVAVEVTTTADAPEDAEITVEVVGDGVQMSRSVACEVGSSQPEIFCYRDQVTVGVAPGSTGNQEVGFTNKGKGEMTGISVEIVDTDVPWLSLRLPQITSLSTKKFYDLRVFADPHVSVPPGRYTATLQITCDTGVHTVPIVVEVSPEYQRDVIFKVTDTQDRIIVGAKIDMRWCGMSWRPGMPAPDMPVPEYHGVTDAIGRCTFEEVPLGYYVLEISAESHIEVYFGENGKKVDYNCDIKAGVGPWQRHLELQFVPFNIDVIPGEFQDTQMLGQVGLGLAVTPDNQGRPALIPNKPAGEYFIQTNQGDNYALLYSGRNDKKSFHRELVVLYDVLVNTWHLDPKNVYVLDCDANPAQWEHAIAAGTPVRTATRDNLRDVLMKDLATAVTTDDALFVYIGDHGGGSSNPLDHTEETLLAWERESVKDDEFAAWAEPINGARETYYFSQCYGGGFLEELGPMPENGNEFGLAQATHHEPAIGVTHARSFPYSFAEGLAQGVAGTHALFKYAYDRDPFAGDGMGPDAENAVNVEHPWMTGADFPIFFRPPGENTVSRTTDAFSINNLSDTEITHVRVRVMDIYNDALVIGNTRTVMELGTIQPHSSRPFTVKVLADLFSDVTEDTLYDGGYLEVTGVADGEVLTTKIPIRIRVGGNIDYHNSVKYEYASFTETVGAAPIQYNRDFVDGWIVKRAATVTPTMLAGSSASQTVTSEGKAFRIIVDVKNTTSDRTLTDVDAFLIISGDEFDEIFTAKGHKVLGHQVMHLFNIVEVATTLEDTLKPNDAGKVMWHVTPRPTLGTTYEGKYKFYAAGYIEYTYNGQKDFMITPVFPMVVDPPPALAVRYSSPRLGETLNAKEAFRIDVTVTNNGLGSANNLTISLPELGGAAGGDLKVVSTSHGAPEALDLALGNLAPGANVSGWWLVQCAKPIQLSGMTSSLVTSEDYNIADVYDRGVTHKEATGSYTAEDLIGALDVLEQALLDKLDSDLDTVALLLSNVLTSHWDVTNLWDVIWGAAGGRRAASMLSFLKTGAAAFEEHYDTGGVRNEAMLSLLGDALAAANEGVLTGSMSSALVKEYLSSLYAYGETWGSALDEIWQRAGGLTASPAAVRSAFLDYVATDLQYGLPLDYLLYDTLAGEHYTPSMVDADLVNAFFDVLLDVQGSWPTVYGSTALKARTGDYFDTARNLLLSGPLPAYFPYDALYEEFEELTGALVRAGAGWGVPEYDRTTDGRLREPTSWYSVGQEGVGPDGGYLPVYLQPWEFGTMYEPAYVVSVLVDHQYEQSKLANDIVALKWLTDGIVSNSGAFMSTPGVGLVGLTQYATAFSAQQAVDGAMDTIFQAQLWGLEHLGNRTIDLLDRMAAEAAGAWRMGWDIKNHIQFLHDNPLEDPPVDLALESIDIRNIEVADGELFGQQTGHVVVTNHYDLPVEVTAVMNVFSGSEEAGTFYSTPMTIESGRTGDLSAAYAAIRSSLVDIDGYDVEVFLKAVDPATMTTTILGPYYWHFFVGTDAELDLLGQQTVRQPLAGEMAEGQWLYAELTPAPTTRRIRILLAQPEQADIDLHLYDLAGDHVGVDYDTGQTDVALVDASYSGPAAALEWIELLVPAGETYRLGVYGVDVPMETAFNVSVVEIPDFPAMLQALSPQVSRITNEQTLDLTLGAAEIGKQHDITNLAAVCSDLTDDSGSTGPGAGVTFELPQTTLAAGQTFLFTGQVALPDGLPDGTYAGQITLTGTDAVSGLSVSVLIDVSIRLDTTPPAVPSIDPIASPVDGPAALSGLASGDTVVELLLDAEHFSYVYPDSQGDWISYYTQIPGGQHVLEAVAIDAAGNRSDASAAQQVTSTVDITPPVTTATVTGTVGANGWYVSSVTVELTADDEAGGSGVFKTWYSFNGGIDWQEYDSAIPLNEDGEHTVWFYSEDNAGNNELVETVTFTIASTEPAVTSVIVQDGQTQRSMVRSLSVTFDQAVTLGTDAITVIDESGTPVQIAVANPSGDQATYVVTFPAPALIGESLADGHYRMTIVAENVHNLGGLALAEDHVTDFYRLFGDVDGDRDVDRCDYIQIRGTLNKSEGQAGFRSEYDYDGSGTVDAPDVAEIRSRLNTWLHDSVFPGESAPIIQSGIASSAESYVESVPVNDGADRRSAATSLTVTVDQAWQVALAAFALTRSDRATVPLSLAAPVDDDRNFVLTFNGPGTVGGSPADGNYARSIQGSLLADLSGQAPTGEDLAHSSHRFCDDWDGDRDMDFVDVMGLVRSYGSWMGLGMYEGAFGSDRDGDVDILDVMPMIYWYRKSLT